MADKNIIPYLAYDEALARFERVNKRSWIVTIILIVLLFLTNGAWLYYESQWETIHVEQNAESDGNSNVSIQNVNGDSYGR